MSHAHLSVERLLERSGVKPAPNGKYRLFDVNGVFNKESMTTEARLRAKSDLVLAGLLD
jgi:hypothetical protein